ncbi:hypothetical protein SynBIOSE41_03868 [Synechococcus sp. BIOS-E4-1]|nr:hypothetical protein SynBIOSE41_03868 [Synechococcus sp. BIOS-E4-1]
MDEPVQQEWINSHNKTCVCSFEKHHSLSMGIRLLAHQRNP